MSDKGDVVIGCIPLHARATPPPEQVGCVLQPCPHCHCQMWVSQNKREIMKSNSPLKPILMCFNCIVEVYPEDCQEAVQMDISEINWKGTKF